MIWCSMKPFLKVPRLTAAFCHWVP